MKRSTKAVLLSALVYPGVGHLYLKKTVPAVLLMLAATAGLYVLMSGAFAQANLIAGKILSGEVQPDIGAVTDLLTQHQDGSGSGKLAWATAFLGIVWVAAVIDAWRTGRATESDLPDQH
jgi:hypothetical protein